MPWTGGVGKGLKRKAKLLRWKTFFFTAPRLQLPPGRGRRRLQILLPEDDSEEVSQKDRKVSSCRKKLCISPFVFFFTLSALSPLSAPQSSKCTKGLYYMVILRVGCHPGTKKARQKTILHAHTHVLISREQRPFILRIFERSTLIVERKQQCTSFMH